MTDDELRCQRTADLRTALAVLIGICQALLWMHPDMSKRIVDHVEEAIADAQRAKDAA